MSKPLSEQVAELEAENAELRGLVDVLGKHVTIPSEHIRIKIPPRMTVHKLHVAPVGSRLVKPEGSIFAPMQKVHSGKWVTVGDELMNTRVQWSAEELIEYGWADATITTPEGETEHE